MSAAAAVVVEEEILVVVEEEDCGAGRGFRRWWMGRKEVLWVGA